MLKRIVPSGVGTGALAGRRSIVFKTSGMSCTARPAGLFRTRVDPSDQTTRSLGGMADNAAQVTTRRSFDDAAGHSLGCAPGYVHRCGRTVRGFSLATAAYAPVNHRRAALLCRLSLVLPGPHNYTFVCIRPAIPTRRPPCAPRAPRPLHRTCGIGVWRSHQACSEAGAWEGPGRCAGTRRTG